MTVLMTVSGAHAQTYPTKPIRMIVPFAPGGGSDLVGRVLAQRLSASLGQQVVVENRAGAGGRIGTEIAARAPADGYTLLFATSSVMVTAPALYPKLPFDMPKDFAPISLVASTAYVLVVHPSVPARSVKDFIAIAKQAPDKLSYASSGPGGPAHLAGELFEALAGVKMVHVPYKGSSPGTLSVVQGETDAMFSNLLPALPAIKSGRLRALGVTSARPSAILPGVSTMASTLPGFEVEQLYAALAPAGTPREIVRRLNGEVHKAVQNADVRAKLATDGSEVHTSTPEELEKRIVAEIAKWSKVIKAAGIKDE
ncbi:MAG TPA: tripartite tricarboxylate transporter substrate binding protein [Burkholderiales bacterium]|nr:tripartite tricarboxylate transporter substrate binding protein [Burkholderiales bacterium]